MKNTILLWVWTGILMSCFSCDKNHDTTIPPQYPGKGHVEIRFRHTVDSVPLVLDSAAYYTASGNMFRVTDLRYFISGVRLKLHGGGHYELIANQGIHYTDLRLPESQQWMASDEVPMGSYDSISFTFGLNQLDNISNRFPDPPERDMFWPLILGGGYHYMQLNSMWKDNSTGYQEPFMMHLGIGQIYASGIPNTDSILEYVQNYFTVKLPSSAFALGDQKTKIIEITMHVDRWFNGPPYQFDLAQMPQGIMQDQELMSKVCQNGQGVFTVTIHE
jgi:hypothetical protein